MGTVSDALPAACHSVLLLGDLAALAFTVALLDACTKHSRPCTGSGADYTPAVSLIYLCRGQQAAFCCPATVGQLRHRQLSKLSRCPVGYDRDFCNGAWALILERGPVQVCSSLGISSLSALGTFYEESITIPNFQMRKPKLKEVKSFARGHTASQQGSSDLGQVSGLHHQAPLWTASWHPTEKIHIRQKYPERRNWNLVLLLLPIKCMSPKRWELFSSLGSWCCSRIYAGTLRFKLWSPSLMRHFTLALQSMKYHASTFAVNVSGWGSHHLNKATKNYSEDLIILFRLEMTKSHNFW